MLLMAGLVEEIRIDGAGSRVFLLHVLLYETNERSVCVKNGASEVVVLVGHSGVHVASLVKLIALVTLAVVGLSFLLVV